MTDPSKVSRILADWFDRQARGEELEPAELLRQHPELADELRAGLDVLELLGEPAAGETLPGTKVPEYIADYRVVREIGRGGMGVVYEAEQVSMRRKVALKVLAPSLTSTGRAVKRFQREAQAAGQLHHTNIVPVFAMGQEQGYWYYAMELVEGRALSDLVHDLRKEAPRRRSQSGLDAFSSSRGSGERPAEHATPATTDDAWFRRIAEVFAGVAAALQVAHEQGIVHRDVKPSNLLLDADGALKIVDFGLAWLDEPGASMTLTGDLVGTPAYMSPEQAMAKRVVIDHRTDIYSLGATIYEVLTLRPPFDGDTLQALCSQIITKDPALPRKIDEHIPKDLETVVLKAMEKDRDKRYQRAADFAQDLQRFATGHVIRARRVGVAERTWRRVRRHRAVSSLVAALLAVGLIGAFFAMRAADEQAQRRHLSYEALLIDAQRAMPMAFRSSEDDKLCTQGVPVGQVLALLDEAIALQPDRPEAYWLRALTEHRTLPECRSDIAAAIARGLAPSAASLLNGYLNLRFKVGEVAAPDFEPITAVGWYTKARLVEAIGPSDEALPLLDHAVRASAPGEVVYFLAMRRRATVLEDSGELSRALADRQVIAAMGYDPAHERLLRASLLDRTGELEKARALYRSIEDDTAISCHDLDLRRKALKKLGEFDDDRRAELLAACDQLRSSLEGENAHSFWRLRADLLEDGADHDGALAALGEALAEQECAGCYERRALVLSEKLGRFPEALAALDSALALEPAQASLHESYGRTLWELGEHERAIQRFDEAIRLDPERLSAYLGRAFSLSRLGRHVEARETLEAALAVDPDDPGTLHDLAALNTDHLDDPQSGLELFERALASKKLWVWDRDETTTRPLRAMLHAHRGNALGRLGRHQEALTAYAQAQEFGPLEKERHNLATSLLELGREDEAQELLRTLVAESRTQLVADPSDGLLRASMAECLRQLGQTEAARDEFARADEQWRGEILAYEPMLLGKYGVLLNRSGEHERALELWKALLERKPDEEQARIGLVESLASLGMTAEAQDAVREALAVCPDSPTLHHHHGALIDEGREQHFAKVLELGWDRTQGLIQIHDWFRNKAAMTKDKSAWRHQVEAAELLLTECRDDPTVQALRHMFLCNQASAIFSQDDASLDALALRKLEEAVELNPRHAGYIGAATAALISREDPLEYSCRSAADRQRLREHALRWLRSFLSVARDGIEQAPIEGADIAALLATMRMPSSAGGATDAFHGVRDTEVLAALPVKERQRWEQLWGDVASLEQQAREVGERAFDPATEVGDDATLRQRFAAVTAIDWWRGTQRAGEHESIALRYRDLSDPARALRHSDLALRDGASLPPDRRAPFYRIRATILFKLGRPADALAALDTAHELDPLPTPYRSAYELRWRVRALIALGQFEEAEQVARDRLELLPDDGHGRRALAEVLHGRGDTADALPHLERAVELLPDDADVHDLLVEVLEALDDVAAQAEQERWARLHGGEEKDAR